MNGESTLPERYERVLGRIRAACAAAHRPADDVGLLAVSKTFSADQVHALAALGQRAFGESYLQEALAKIDACADLTLEWHFIGPLQSNKTRPVAERFDWVHSVDRERIARRLSEQRPAQLPQLNVCLQVNVSAEATKSGCAPDEVAALARLVSTLPGLRLRGLMAIPAPTTDPVVQRAQFARLRQIQEQLHEDGMTLDTLSMGMSDDLEAAIAEGSTLVRVGSALFGARQSQTEQA